MTMYTLFASSQASQNLTRCLCPDNAFNIFTSLRTSSIDIAVVICQIIKVKMLRYQQAIINKFEKRNKTFHRFGWCKKCNIRWKTSLMSTFTDICTH